MNNKFLPGQITIGRPHGTNCDYITIQLVDKSSGARFVDVKIKYADFAKALTGEAFLDCEFATRGLDLIGKVREVKTEKVYVPYKVEGFTSDEIVECALLIHEVDGWKGRKEDARNSHKIHRRAEDGAWHNVIFIRHVDRENS